MASHYLSLVLVNAIKFRLGEPPFFIGFTSESLTPFRFGPGLRIACYDRLVLVDVNCMLKLFLKLIQGLRKLLLHG